MLPRDTIETGPRNQSDVSNPCKVAGHLDVVAWILTRHRFLFGPPKIDDEDEECYPHEMPLEGCLCAVI
jgi:hypothetical protein